MRNSFRGIYKPTEDEFNRLWQECLYVVDTNVLLSLYTYSNDAREKYKILLRDISDRLWIPHQVSWEFLKNRFGKIDEANAQYYKAQNLHKSLLNKIQSAKDDDISYKEIIDTVNSIEEYLENQKQEYPFKKYDDDPILEFVLDLFENKVGEPYENKQLQNIYTEGEIRYTGGIPPGYKDDKPENKYGDLILWFQILEKAEESETPIILITKDKKSDWWSLSNGRIVAPRFELIDEMYTKTNMLFYMYSLDKFADEAKKYLQIDVGQPAIDEAQEVSKAYMPPPPFVTGTFIPDTSGVMASLRGVIKLQKTYDDISQGIVDQGRYMQDLVRTYTIPANLISLSDVVLKASPYSMDDENNIDQDDESNDLSKETDNNDKPEDT